MPQEWIKLQRRNGFPFPDPRCRAQRILQGLAVDCVVQATVSNYWLIAAGDPLTPTSGAVIGTEGTMTDRARRVVGLVIATRCSSDTSSVRPGRPRVAYRLQ